MNRPSAAFAAVALSLLASAPAVLAEDWAQWRGPSRDGRVPGFPNPAAWPKELTKRWQVTVGEGHSSPLIVGARAFVLVRRGEREHTLCLDLATGKTLWEDAVDAPFDSVIFPARRLGKSPRSTPLWHGGRLYTVGVNGVLSCLDAKTGKALWRREFASRFPLPMPICGASLSPLIDGGRLYLHVGHGDRGAFLALDKETGKELWAWEGEGPAYTSPQLVRVGGARQIVTAAHNSWIGLDPETGRLLWSQPNRQNMFNHNSVDPVLVGDTLVCGANQRSTVGLRLKKAGGGWTPEKAWETRDITMSTGAPLLWGARVIAFSERRRGQIVSLEAATGMVLWSCPGNKGEHATLLDAGPNVLAFTTGGELFVYAKAPATGALEERARYQVADGAMWAGPAVSGNRVLIKGAETLTLWEVPAK